MDNEWTTVNWVEVEEFLKLYWYSKTNKELPESQLEFLGMKLCSGKGEFFFANRK